MNLTPSQNARISIVRASAASSDLATRLSALRWGKDNLLPIEKAALYNNMRQFWGDYTQQERELYTALAQSADLDLRSGNVGCSHCTGVGCNGNSNCKCQQYPNVGGVGFSLSDFGQGAKVGTDLAKEAAALGVNIDTYIKCTQKENWAAPYCPWNKGKSTTDTANQPGKAATPPTPPTPPPTKKDDDDDESNPWLIPVVVGSAIVGFFLLMNSGAIVPVPVQQPMMQRAA